MTTVEKMYQIKKLMDEVEIEVSEVAESIKDIDKPLYRMLTEGCSDYFRIMSKNLHSISSGNQIDNWKKQLDHAYSLKK